MSKTQLILFDGVCSLCNGTVQFIMKHDRKKKFSFEPLQSPTGEEVLKKIGLSPAERSTVVYMKNGIPFFKSKAILMILKDMGRGWNLFYAFIIIPSFIRDFIYDRIAAKRRRHPVTTEF